MPDMPAITEHVELEVKLAVPAVYVLPALVSPAAAGPPPGIQTLDGQPVVMQTVEVAEVMADPAAALDDGVPTDLPGADAPADTLPTAGRLAAAVPGRRRSLRAAYYDTVDLRLARSGATLRHRTGEGKPTWTLKLPTGREGERLELSVPGAATTMPPQVRSLVTAQVRDGSLAEVVRLTTRRDTWSLRDDAGSEIAELVDDLVSVLASGTVVARFRELEIERSGIGHADLDALVRRLTDAGAVRGVFTSKLARALGPRASAAPDVPEPTPVKRGDPVAALAAEAVRDGVRRLLAQDPRVRLGRDDAVHQLRVACRRLRSDLATFGPLLVPGAVDGVRSELAWLAEQLGAARDLEVLRARLAKTFRADRLAPLNAAAMTRLDALLAAREQAALREAAETLAEPRYVALLTAIVSLAVDPPTTEAAQQPVKVAMPPLVAGAVADLDAAVERLTPHGADAKWHRARIRAKRARYAAEAAAVALGEHAAVTGRAMAAVQEVLGDHQDAAIAADAVLAIAVDRGEDPALVLLCGRLAERERAAVTDARTRFAAAWKAAEAKPVRRWLS